MWKWRMDTGHEDWRQQGVAFSAFFLESLDPQNLLSAKSLGLKFEQIT